VIGRRGFIAAMATLMVVPAAEAQPPGKIPRIGVMYAGSAPNPYADALRRGLAELAGSQARTSSSRVATRTDDPNGIRRSSRN
jgi:hypothetical protein